MNEAHSRIQLRWHNSYDGIISMQKHLPYIFALRPILGSWNLFESLLAFSCNCSGIWHPNIRKLWKDPARTINKAHILISFCVMPIVYMGATKPEIFSIFIFIIYLNLLIPLSLIFHSECIYMNLFLHSLIGLAMYSKNESRTCHLLVWHQRVTRQQRIKDLPLAGVAPKSNATTVAVSISTSTLLLKTAFEIDTVVEINMKNGKRSCLMGSVMSKILQKTI